jgi:hypothetical protein
MRFSRFVVFLAAVTLAIAGCWDPVTGPAIRSNFSDPVVVTVQFNGLDPLTFTLESGQTIWQRPQGHEIRRLEVRSVAGAQLLILSYEELGSLGLSRDHNVIEISEAGARTTTYSRRQTEMKRTPTRNAD